MNNNHTNHNKPLNLPTEQDTQNAKKSRPAILKQNWFLAVSIVLLVLFVICIGVVSWFVLALNSVMADLPVNGKVITVEQNSSLESIGSQLEQNGLIGNKTVFLLYAKFGPARGRLQPGPYLVKPTTNISQIVANMSAGRIAVNKITFPEGITIEQMATRYEAAGYGTRQQYIEATKSLAKNYSFIPTAYQNNPEGYLYPATYEFTVNSPAETLVTMQYEAFKEQMQPLLSNLSNSNLDAHQMLTLASIVEKEGTTISDRKLISGVLRNRLSQGMRLESDVTVNYITGRTQTRAEDLLNTVSPYNSYKVYGLPPTPICNPSKVALQATISYTSSDFLFFIAGRDGTVHYARTFAEHNQNIEKYLKN